METSKPDSEQIVADSLTTSRRTALKGAAGLAAGVIVWSEPSIKGLAQRPAYASALSGPNDIVLEMVVRVRNPANQRRPRILSVSNADPFGYGSLNFRRNFNGSNGRPRFRLSNNQSGGNANARLVSVTNISPADGQLISFTPNGNGWIRWASGTQREDYTLMVNFVCD